MPQDNPQLQDMLSLDENMLLSPEKAMQSCETDVEIDPDANIFGPPDAIREVSPELNLRNTGRSFGRARGPRQRICTRHGAVADRNTLSPSRLQEHRVQL